MSVISSDGAVCVRAELMMLVNNLVITGRTSKRALRRMRFGVQSGRTHHRHLHSVCRRVTKNTQVDYMMSHAVYTKEEAEGVVKTTYAEKNVSIAM